jgi:Fanconi anemia group M protein
VVAEVMKISHALELLESQGLAPLSSYLQKLQEEAAAGQSKAVRNLVVDPRFKIGRIRLDELIAQGIEHPKIQKVRNICEAEFAANPKSKIILFTQFRDSATRIKEALTGLPNVLPEIFVGQATKKGTGLSQKQQVEMLQQFGDGLFNVLIAPCVAEEGGKE